MKRAFESSRTNAVISVQTAIVTTNETMIFKPCNHTKREQ